MAWIEVEGWRAGRAWKSKNGKLSYYIRREARDIATGATTLRGALAALERFEKTGDPRPPEDEPVVLEDTAAGDGLAAQFLAHLRAKGDSVEWRRKAKRYLSWWADQLRGRDLRAGRRGSVTILDIRRALDGVATPYHREAVLRHFYTFLRGADRIATADDPIYGKPRIAPPSRPAQDTIDKTIDRGDLETTIGYLDAQWQEHGQHGRRWSDLLRLLDGTGMHVTELRRFAEGGKIEPLPACRPTGVDEAAVLMVPLHKSGAPYRVAVSEATAEVAKRVRESGTFSFSDFQYRLRRAAKATGAKVLAGSFRHTTAKHALEAGATMQQIGTFLGHKSPATTRRYYATLGVPAKVPTRR